MPPTFGTLPHLVRAIVPGGQEKVTSKAASEAEDHYEDGVRGISRLRVSKTDVVVGISASGTTPFVRGALTRTRKTGAKLSLSYEDAMDRLKNSRGSIREATGEDIERRLRELLRIDRMSR